MRSNSLLLNQSYITRIRFQLSFTQRFGVCGGVWGVGRQSRKVQGGIHGHRLKRTF